MNSTDAIQKLLKLVDHYTKMGKKYDVIGISDDYIQLYWESFIVIAKGKEIKIIKSEEYYHYSFIENSVEFLTVVDLIEANKIDEALGIEKELKDET